MDSVRFQELVSELKTGKKLPDTIYLHRSALEFIGQELKDFTFLIASAGKVDPEWNVVKFYRKSFRISYLTYPRFVEDSYPSLHKSSTVDLQTKTKKEMDYSGAENPPILHRKELFVHSSHPEFEAFSHITQEGELAGLYENPRRIGFLDSWLRLIEQNGYSLVDGRLFRAAAAIDGSNDESVDRYKTAIQRQSLSTPMKTLAKHGYLSGEYSVFDYGCGLGDDLRELEAHGVDAAGWDPAHRPDADILPAQIVNLGFVINVVEDKDERIEALIRAYELADSLLVVSAMLASESHIQKFKPYKDGVITSRNTFQKYYSQAELQVFIEQTLDESAVAVGPGVFYVFKDKFEEQEFLSNRQRRHHHWRQLSERPRQKSSKIQLLIDDNKELCADFWAVCLLLGRLPAIDEYSCLSQVNTLFGSGKRLFNHLIKDTQLRAEFDLAVEYRKEDLILYFALAMFQGRKAYSQLTATIKRDVKAFFGAFREAQFIAQEALFSVSDVELIESTSIEASKLLPACLLDGESLILHIRYLDLLPLPLRLYVGCAAQLYGDLDEVDLVKIHIHSGKVSLMVYEGFDGSPLPLLMERIKIKMRDQDVDFFDYVDSYIPPPLYLKSKLIDDGFDDYEKQASFDKRLQALIPSIQGMIGPPKNELIKILSDQGKEIRGYRFYSIKHGNNGA
ncbi:DNA phosphorothioation-associated putative methyltransferase [Neptuniibacter sp. PT8_73]|uniref:DNA phosphorothioation-associated putative methyltransferase n=1 Tax=Neptuniibacter sp. PT8_73 TaxID=3398206 RepID=UPI0039F5D7C7